MQILKGKPPVYDRIIDAGLKPTENTVFTYGDKLYIQDLDEKQIEPVLLAHEETHTKQQGDDIEGWWDKYINDEKFRFDQELEAYGAEYKKVIDMGFKDKFKKYALNAFAKDLSSSMYGSIITIHEAESKIRNKAKSM